MSRSLRTPCQRCLPGSLRLGIPFEHAAVLELEDVVALGGRIGVEVRDLLQELLGARPVAAGRTPRTARPVISRLDDVVAECATSTMNFWFRRTIRPAASTTRIPSAVDSSVASRSDREDLTSAADRRSLVSAAVRRSRRMATRAPLTSTVPVTRAEPIGSCGGTRPGPGSRSARSGRHPSFMRDEVEAVEPDPDVQEGVGAGLGRREEHAARDERGATRCWPGAGRAS